MEIIQSNSDFTVRRISGYEIARMYNKGLITGDIHDINAIKAMVQMAELELPICLQLVTSVTPNTTSGIQHRLFNGWIVRFMWDLYNKTDSYNNPARLSNHVEDIITVTPEAREHILSTQFQWLSLHFDDTHTGKINDVVKATKDMAHAVGWRS